MASERIEWVLRQVETWNSDEVDAFLDALGPEFAFTPDPSFPDADTYRGERLRRWFREWAHAWQDSRLEVLGITEQGPALIVDSRWHLTAPQTGVEVPNSDFTLVIWFDRERDDRPRRTVAYFDRERAVEAARDNPG